MSIPGLGQFAPAAAPTSGASTSASSPITTQTLQPFWEYRFEVPVGSSLTIRLLSGTAEKDGTELAPNTPYTFTATKSKINTWHGCALEVSSPAGGGYDAYTSEPGADETPMVSYLNLHFKLEGMRDTARATGGMGPRVLVVGPPTAGKTSLVRTLTGWATRMGRQPLVVNADCREGLLALPGTLSAAVFATVIDPASAAAGATGWGATPSSGPSAVPVKLPLAYYYGLPAPDDNPRRFRRLLSRLAVAATGRLAADPDVRAAGMLIDTGGTLRQQQQQQQQGGAGGYEHVAHIVAEYSVNIVVVLGSERMGGEMQRRLAGQRTTLGEPVAVVALDRSGGVVERDAAFMQQVREAAIREYFFGDARTTLSPFTQQVDFAALAIWRINEAPATSSSGDEDVYASSADALDAATMLERAEPTMMMQNCLLAVVCASPHDPADAIRDASAMGFVYVADVDEKRRRLRVLAPVSARLGDRPLLWGAWPEPMVSLLG
ncbi:Pre-mRNA cleavage complex II protein Clp1-domain-containing protein [Xylariaceae sp. FL0804]|nr:Pre-mRNA cleavage complex II protein Clp1-domain-containing protein [Xylariaceae sp. FL0804]